MQIAESVCLFLISVFKSPVDIKHINYAAPEF